MSERRAVFKSSEATGHIIEIFTLKLFDASLVSLDTALFLTEVFYWRHPEWMRKEIKRRYEALLRSEDVRQIISEAERKARGIVASADAYKRAEAEARARALVEEARRKAELAALIMAITDVHADYGFAWVTKRTPVLGGGTIPSISELEGKKEE